MKILAIVFAATISVCGWSRLAQTAEIKVLSAAGIKSVVEDLARSTRKRAATSWCLSLSAGLQFKKPLHLGEEYDAGDLAACPQLIGLASRRR